MFMKESIEAYDEYIKLFVESEAGMVELLYAHGHLALLDASLERLCEDRL